MPPLIIFQEKSFMVLITGQYTLSFSTKKPYTFKVVYYIPHGCPKPQRLVDEAVFNIETIYFPRLDTYSTRVL